MLKEPYKLIIATSKKASKNKIKALQKKGVNVLIAATKKGMVDLEDLMKQLGNLEITSIMIEGGAELNSEAIKAGVVDKVLFFIAPKIIGGRTAVTSVEGKGVAKVSQAVELKNMSIEKIGKDILIIGEPINFTNRARHEL